MTNRLNLKSLLTFAIVLGLMIGGIVFVTGNLTPENDSTPQNVTVGDVSSRQLNISWVTSNKTGGQINYGTTPALGSVKATPGLVAAHLVSLDNLKPNTTYFFLIGDNQNKFGQDGKDGTVPYTARTLAETTLPDEAVKKVDDSKKVAVATAFGSLLGEKTARPQVLAETTGSGTPPPTYPNAPTAPNGANPIPTVLIALAAAISLGFGFRLLKN